MITIFRKDFREGKEPLNLFSVLTRNGTPVTIVATGINSKQPIVGILHDHDNYGQRDTVEQWYSNGRYQLGSTTESPLDLINRPIEK